MNIAYTKPALTVEAQVRLLESRGMTIEDRAFAERALAAADGALDSGATVRV